MNEQLSAMQIITYSSKAREACDSAFEFAKTYSFNEAEEEIRRAQELIKEAHDVQTKLLVSFARGESIEVNLLLVHSQDHLMSAMTLLQVTSSYVDLYRKIEQIQ